MSHPSVTSVLRFSQLVQVCFASMQEATIAEFLVLVALAQFPRTIACSVVHPAFFSSVVVVGSSPRMFQTSFPAA